MAGRAVLTVQYSLSGPSPNNGCVQIQGAATVQQKLLRQKMAPYRWRSSNARRGLDPSSVPRVAGNLFFGYRKIAKKNMVIGV